MTIKRETIMMANNNFENIKNNANEDKTVSYDFDRVDVYDIKKARENTKKLSRPKMYDYANKISKKVNESIKAASEKGDSRCNVFITLKEIFGEAMVTTNDYLKILDYITGLYSLKGYDISVYTSRIIRKFPDQPSQRASTYMKIYIGWE